jgi:hypothetical protein
MKLFKILDTLIQLLFLIAIVINYFTQGQKDAALLCVIGFGAWQVLSSLIHFFLKIKKTWWRLAYSVAGVLILFLLLALKLDIFSRDTFIFLMLVIAPTMGTYYFVLSCTETITNYRKTKINNSLETV